MLNLDFHYVPILDGSDPAGSPGGYYITGFQGEVFGDKCNNFINWKYHMFGIGILDNFAI